jgi:hypothetical protein
MTIDKLKMTNEEKYYYLQEALVEAVVAIREELSNLEDPPTYLNFEIECDGRVLDGDVEIKFSFNGGNYTQATKGGNLSNVVGEFMRRYGWNKRNDPLCLPKVENDE